MFYPPKLLVRDWWVGIPLLIVLACQAIVWWYFFARLPYGNEQTFLHYNTVFGIDLVGPRWKFIFLPGGGLLIALLNYFLGWMVYGEERLLARLLIVSAAAMQIFLLATIILLIRLNL